MRIEGIGNVDRDQATINLKNIDMPFLNIIAEKMIWWPENRVRLLTVH
jgi:hypothetical protein